MFILHKASQDTSTSKGKDSLHTITEESTIIAITVPTKIHVLIFAKYINRTITQAGLQVNTVLIPTINLGNAAMNATVIPMTMLMVAPTTQETTALLVRITTPITEDAVIMTHIM